MRRHVCCRCPTTPRPCSNASRSASARCAGPHGAAVVRKPYGYNLNCEQLRPGVVPQAAAAVANAQLLGVNPSALAATCVVESGCQNVSGYGTVAGAFQMTASTYTAMINAAVAQNPSLASQIVPGLAGQMDPATESIAASEYLLQANQYLQGQGIANPTVLDVRSYYNFGPSAGAAIANATDGQTMASLLANLSPSQLTANGITSGETVGQWRASVAAKIGNAASQSVLT